MILVILGTQDKSFHRLLEAVDREIKNGHIKERVVVQAGWTKYQSDRMEIFDLLPMKKFDDLIHQASLIITHGGVGSIMSALRHQKKIIAVAREEQYFEHTNDHQKQIISEFVKQGYILDCKDLDHLDQVLKTSEKFKPKKYHSNNHKMMKILGDFIGI